MELENTFTVPVGVERAWSVLNDVERIGPCMPGATITSVDGDDFTGEVRVRVGPVSMRYTGRASFTERDDTAHRAVIVAKGKEARGSGTATATVSATLREADDGTTEVHMRTDLAVTGRPAQFGRGVLADVSNKLVGQFAECLSGELGADAAAGDAEGVAAEEAAMATAAPPMTGATASGPGPAVEGTAAGATPPGAAAATAAQPTLATVGAVQDVPPVGEEGKRVPYRTATPPDAGGGGRPTRPTADEIDLVGVAGAPLAKRLAPAAVAFLLLLLVLRLRARRR